MGHQVKVGSRDPNKGVPLPEAAQFGEAIVLATMWAGTEQAIALAGKANFAGKVVLDAPTRSSTAPTASA